MTTDEWRKTRGWDHYCFYCYRTIVGPIPSDWGMLYGQGFCRSCLDRAESEGGMAVVVGGAYSEGRPDPAATNPKYV